jgi:hypothetical protein
MWIAKFVIISVAMLMVGCAAPKFNYKPVALDISEPPLNEVVQRSVGEEMLKQGKFALVDVLNVEISTKPHWGVTINQGIFRRTGSDEEANYYELGGRGGENGSVEKNWAVDPLKVLMIKKDDKSICAVTIFNAKACTDKEKENYKEERRSVVFENTVQQTLIYSGRIGSRIRFGYREFSNNLARPAFSNDVEYDLMESKIVAYKGAMIEIIEATNQHIKYIVKKNFNKAIGPIAPEIPAVPNERKIKQGEII